MASKAMHKRMAKMGRPVHCADGKWRNENDAFWFMNGWDENRLWKGSKKASRLSFIAGFEARERLCRGGAA